jgi:predicted peroxiredoxin
MKRYNCGKELKLDTHTAECGQITVNGIRGYVCECGVNIFNVKDVEFIQEIEARVNIPEDKEIVITLETP